MRCSRLDGWALLLRRSACDSELGLGSACQDSVPAACDWRSRWHAIRQCHSRLRHASRARLAVDAAAWRKARLCFAACAAAVTAAPAAAAKAPT